MRPSSEAAALACSLFTRHQSRIYRQCLHNLRSAHDAEDALQQTFVNALQALRAGVTPRIEVAWLLQIARNVCLERQRNAGRRARIEFIASPDSLVDVASAQPDDDGSYLVAALERLEPRQREALVLREWRGLSYRELAGVLQLSQSAVEALLFRARRSLARALEDTRRLRPTFNWGSLLVSYRAAFSGAASKTVVIAACCGITVVGVPVLEQAVTHRAGPTVVSSPLQKVVAATPRSGVAAAPRAEPSRHVATRRKRPDGVTAAAATPPVPTPGVGGGSGATTEVGGAGRGDTVSSDFGGIPTGGVEAPSQGATPTRAERPSTEGAGESGVSAQISTGGVSAQISAGDTGVTADVGVATDGADASARVDVSPPALGGDAPAADAAGVSVGADVGVSAGEADTGAVAADVGVSIGTGQTGVGVDVGVGVDISLP